MVRSILKGSLLPLMALAAACGDDDQGPRFDPTVQVFVTDAPADYIETAEIWVSRVYLQGGTDVSDDDADDDGVDDGEDEDVPGRVDLFNDPANPRHFDLLALRDGVVEALTADVEVDVGSYAQLRLVVDSARVTLVEGFEFRDGSTTDVLRVPSGSSSGIKVQLPRAIEADEGEEIEITVDFDVDENFVIQGNPGTQGVIQGILFRPLLRELSRTEGDRQEG